MRWKSSSILVVLMLTTFSATSLLLIALSRSHRGDAEPWQVWAIVGLWFAVVFIGVRGGVSRRTAVWVTVSTGSFWYAVLGVLEDDGSGLWPVGLVFALPMLVVISLAAGLLAELAGTTS